MLGVVIGVVSVITTVSLGEGVKQQVVRQISEYGEDLITVLPGKKYSDNNSYDVSMLNPFSAQNSILFGDGDYQAVRNTPGLKLVVPFGQVVGAVKTDGQSFDSAQIIATNEGLPDILNQDTQYGSFFKDNDKMKNGAVIGKRVAEQLFRENVPMGKSFTIRDREFIVRGVFKEFASSSPLLPVSDYNNAIFIDYRDGQELMSGNLQIYQILAKPSDAESVDTAATNITNTLKNIRGGQEDFTVLKQAENLELAGRVLNLLTGMIAGIAAISLIVGGIGIMNIMLVSVTERTSEIGIRKAVGATNRQILYQFTIEAVVLSLSGGILGIFVSILTNFFIRIVTDLQPVITLPVIVIATGVSLAVGVVFGITPAIKAARKDPIDALRYE